MALIYGASALSVQSSLTVAEGQPSCQTLCGLNKADRKNCLEDKDFIKEAKAHKEAFISKAVKDVPKKEKKRAMRKANKKYKKQGKNFKKAYAKTPAAKKHKTMVTALEKEICDKPVVPQPKTSAVKVS